MEGRKKTPAREPERHPTVGEGLVEAFEEIAAHLRGEVALEGRPYVPEAELTPARIRDIRKSVGSRKAFEAMTGIPSGTMEGYELGRLAGRGHPRPAEGYRDGTRRGAPCAWERGPGSLIRQREGRRYQNTQAP